MPLRTRQATAHAIGGEEGFTLVELLVVLVIIGLLAAIAIPAFFNQREKSYDTRAQSNIRNLATMIESCHTESAYADCQTQNQLQSDTLVLGSGKGEVQVLLNPLGSGGVAASGLSNTGTTFVLYMRNGISEHLCKPPAGESLPKGKCVAGGAYGADGYGTW